MHSRQVGLVVFSISKYKASINNAIVVINKQPQQ